MKKIIFIICWLFVANLVYSQEKITIKKGESKTLSVQGGSGKIVKWYSGSCGGALVGEGEKITITPSETTTYYGRWEDGHKFSDCQIITIVVTDEPPPIIPTPTPSTSIDPIVLGEKEVKQTPKATEKVYSFGKYVGSLKNGIPEGNGKMYYNKHVRIAKHDKDKNLKDIIHYAESGDYFDGSWGNGDIVCGFLYHKDGSKEEILVPKRFNTYDISND